MAERETLETDVLFVGAGPATLAAALHLQNLCRASRVNPSVMILEKAAQPGGHTLSGAVLDPRALNELMPDFRAQGAPAAQEVTEDGFYFLGRGSAVKLPWTPPRLANHGHFIISLGEWVAWLAEKAKTGGADLFCGVPASGLLMEGGRVSGVRTGDKGIDKTGKRKPNFEPGIDIRAKVTVLGEGAHGSLTKELVSRLNLNEGRNPQTYSLGLKEVWEVPAKNHRPGKVVHTFGFPLEDSVFGGGFLYHAAGGKVYAGFVAGLDYGDPRFDPHHAFQTFKTHPLVKETLSGGRPLGYGAKVIPEGGYYALPKYYGEGFLLTGDSAGFLDSMRLKGIHLAMKSGMLAAETVHAALGASDFSEKSLRGYEERVEKSWLREELWKVRNFHQGFKSGMKLGLARAAFQMLAGGRDVLGGRLRAKKDHEELRRTGPAREEKMSFDGQYLFDKRDGLIFSGTRHNEDQPSHLQIADFDICRVRCTAEFGNPCRNFCPANVYEMVETSGVRRLQVNAANCLHCKTCDIMDPYQIIRWVTPEGGGGPNYRQM